MKECDPFLTTREKTKLSWENEGKETPVCRAVVSFDSSILHNFHVNEWLFVSNRHFSSRSWGGVRVRTSVHSESVSFECVNIFLFQRKKPTIENSSLSQFTSHVEHTHEHSSAHSATVREIDAFRLSMRRTHFIYSFVFFLFWTITASSSVFC